MSATSENRELPNAAQDRPRDKTGKTDPMTRLAFAPLMALWHAVREGAITIRLPDGSAHRFDGGVPGPEADLTIHNHRFVRRILTGGDLGFAEAYMAGDCSTPDLNAVMRLALVNETYWSEKLRGQPWYRAMQRLGHLMRPNSRSKARSNILAHYDLGNRFYETWLDPTMTYSSAVFDENIGDLEKAQVSKYRRIAQSAEMRMGDSVLEIGCGWGGFAVFAAGEVGCKVTGITISDEQFEYANRRVQREGLGDRIEIRKQDYRDVSESFDRVASIEMFEAVGEKYWPVYFSKISDCLRSGGLAALQVITISEEVYERYRRGADFIQRYIFPGGMLPSPTVFERVASVAGLKAADTFCFGQHYAETLARWHGRFEERWPEITEMGFDEKFRRMWKYYLAYCEEGFRAKKIDVRQTALVKA